MPQSISPFNAIVSVSDPTNLPQLGKTLAEMGATIYATGGTMSRLREAGVEARSVSELTGFPEILGGRVKTLHPGVHSGILARRDDPSQMAQLVEHGLQTVDLVAVNLYPFAQTVAREGVTLEEATEQIDVGGPTMIRAAAKNFASVVVLSDPADYEWVLTEWRERGEVSQETRRQLAAKAFRHVSEYDALVAGFLGVGGQGSGVGSDTTQSAVRSPQHSTDPRPLTPDTLPPQLTLNLRQAQSLRYGENPHQVGALYADDLPVEGATLVGSLKQLQGPELSFNNLMDADAALSLARDYAMPAVAIIKHAGPCGLACGGDEDDLGEIFERALASDPVSAFGGIVGINRPVDSRLAEVIARTRFDLIVAPGFDEEAVDLLARRKNLRLLAVPNSNVGHRDAQFASALAFRQVSGGFLAQTRDADVEEVSMEAVTLRHPTLEELADLTFAWRAVKHVRSNAIVLARKLATVGIGGGQTSRVASVKIAVEKAEWKARGAALASDGFFPFADGLQVAADAGVTAVIQPGGSIKDDEVIEAADVAGMAMVFTGKRHFRH